MAHRAKALRVIAEREGFVGVREELVLESRMDARIQ